MKIGRSFKFVFRSPNAWAKLFRGGLYSALFFTVYFAFVVQGYLVRMMCDLLEGRESKLPEWDTLSELFNDGLQPVLIALAYSSPIIVLSVLSLYINAPIIFIIQALLIVLVSGLLPLAIIHFVTARSIGAAFNFPVILTFIRENSSRVVGAWLLTIGLGLSTLAVGTIISLVMAVPVALLSTVKTGAIIGFALGVMAFLFGGFLSITLIAHIYSQMYRASTPFNDDKEGTMRASIVMPPSLKK